MHSAVELGCDMLVMGAYGHSRFRGNGSGWCNPWRSGCACRSTDPDRALSCYPLMKGSGDLNDDQYYLNNRTEKKNGREGNGERCEFDRDFLDQEAWNTGRGLPSPF